MLIKLPFSGILKDAVCAFLFTNMCLSAGEYFNMIEAEVALNKIKNVYSIVPADIIAQHKH